MVVMISQTPAIWSAVGLLGPSVKYTKYVFVSCFMDAKYVAVIYGIQQ